MYPPRMADRITQFGESLLGRYATGGGKLFVPKPLQSRASPDGPANPLLYPCPAEVRSASGRTDFSSGQRSIAKPRAPIPQSAQVDFVPSLP